MVVGADPKRDEAAISAIVAQDNFISKYFDSLTGSIQ